MADPRRIDVHHHVTPPSYIAAASQITYGNAPRMSWSLERSLDDMDKGGVETAIISLPHPVTIWPEPKDKQRALARDWNEFVAKMAQDHPGRFGLFASLPILDIDGSLKEIDHAYSALNADGINLITNIGDKWLGDPYYDPIFAELNRRKAVIYTHPLAPNCLHDCLPGVNNSVIEFGSDTTRAIASLIFGGATTRYPDIQWIFSHARRNDAVPGRALRARAGPLGARGRRRLARPSEALSLRHGAGGASLGADGPDAAGREHADIVRNRFPLSHRDGNRARHHRFRFQRRRPRRDRSRQCRAADAAVGS